MQRLVDDEAGAGIMGAAGYPGLPGMGAGEPMTLREMALREQAMEGYGPPGRGGMPPWAQFGREPEDPPPKFVITRGSRQRVVWSALLYLALSYDLMLFPVKLVFVGNQIEPVLMGLDVLFDIMLLLDAFAQFSLAYYDEGRLEMSKK